MSTLLLICVLTPLVGAILLATLSALEGDRFANWVALGITLLTLGMSVVLVRGFLAAAPGAGLFAEVDRAWLSPSSGVDVHFHLALDGISLWLFALSALLLVTSVLVSWTSIKDRPALFYAMLLLLETGCLGVFSARDIILFYIFFEFTLIPLVLPDWDLGQRGATICSGQVLSVHTGRQPLDVFGALDDRPLASLASRSFPSHVFDCRADGRSVSRILYRPACSGGCSWHSSLVLRSRSRSFRCIPGCRWLTFRHQPQVVCILAGILLKIGTYGFLRFSIPMLPEATATCMPWLLWLAVAGIVYGALVALAQSDIKRLIAYSSVSHLGFCMLGLFALNPLGTQGAVLQMVNHGLSTGGLFAIVGMLYERYHTREIRELGGVARHTPILAFFMLLFTLSSIGLPGLNGFAGEIMILLGMFQRGWLQSTEAFQAPLRVVGVLALSGVVLGAWYMLWLVQRVFFGPVKLPGDDGQRMGDLNVREIAALVPLAIFIIWIGICPQFFLQPMAVPLQQATRSAEQWADMAPVVAAQQVDPSGLTYAAQPLIADGYRKAAAAMIK